MSFKTLASLNTMGAVSHTWVTRIPASSTCVFMNRTPIVRSLSSTAGRQSDCAAAGKSRVYTEAAKSLCLQHPARSRKRCRTPNSVP